MLSISRDQESDRKDFVPVLVPQKQDQQKQSFDEFSDSDNDEERYFSILVAF